MKPGLTQLVRYADLAAFDEIIDVRTPAEFAEDHAPGAINCPVLDDAQRVEVGTLYKQVSPFAAKKIGAAYVAENVARHLRERFLDRPKSWRPLVMCWRGGERSGAMTHILRRVGWDAQQLDGGYKAYRRLVVDTLVEQPRDFAFQVVCGATGSGKSRLLQALAARGAQVLDLEALACHKGSVLGVLPDADQPSQKAFETRLLAALAGLPVPAKVPKLIILETAADDPLVVTEQLMPVLPIVRVDNFEQGLALALKVEDGLHHTAIMHSQNVSRLNKAAHLMQTSIFVKNGPSFAGIGVGAEGFTTFTIATPTGEGTTSARTFGRLRRCVLTNGFSIR